MNRESLRASLATLVAHAIPKNARQIHCSFLDDQLQHNMLGMRVDPRPSEGRVVGFTDDAFIVKTDRTKFVAVDTTLATVLPSVDDKVRLTPYARRNFAGARLDETTVETRTSPDGEVYTVKSFVIGGTPVRIPRASPPRCAYLADMMEQLEALPTPDGRRTIVNMLVDANAKDIEFVDPDEENLFTTPPEISFAVDTRKFTGRIALQYDRGLDLYVVELRADGNALTRIEEVDITTLAEIMTDLIDDGEWRRVHVEILTPTRNSIRAGAR